MAFTYTEVQSVSQKYFDSSLENVQQIYESDPLWTKLQKKQHIVPGGEKIAWTLRLSEYGKAKAYGPREQWEYGQKETRTMAEIPWRYYGNQTLMSWDEIVQNSGKQKIIDLVGDKSAELKEDLINKMIADLYTTNPAGDGMSSLDEIVDSSTTYAGIAVSDASAWAAKEDTTTTRLSLYGGAGSLSYMVNQATFGELKPDFHITTRDMYSTFEGRFEGKIRYMDDDLKNAGFNSLVWRGAPVVGSGKVRIDDTTNDDEHWWLGLCLDVLYLVYHPKFNFKLEPWQELDQAGHPYAMKREYVWVGNLKAKIRRVHFKMTELDPSL